MAKFKLGSICLDELFAVSKAGHSSVTTAKNGKKYASIIIWENEEVDKYGNNGSIQLNSTKENKESEAKIYSVHQLQNLFHALTGEELEIKL